MPRELDVAIVGVLIPPLQVYRKRQNCQSEFILDLLLFIIGLAYFPFWGIFHRWLWMSYLGWLPFICFIASICYCFHLEGLTDVAANIFCCLIPPLGLYISTKKCDIDILIALLLWFLFWFPGAIYAYYKA